MKKMIFFLALLGPFCLWAQQGSESPRESKPLIEVAPSIHHLGTIPDTKPVSFVFSIANHSTQVITISKIATHCGCTAANPNPKELKPGESSKLAVTFDPSGREGFALWEVDIFTDFPQMPRVVAAFDVTILKDGMLSHQYVSFGEFQRGATPKQKIWIAPLDKPDFSIKEVKVEIPDSQESCFAVTYTQGTYTGFYPGPRKAYCVEISAMAEIPYGRIEGKLNICTDIPGKEMISLPLFAKVAGEIGIRPDYVSMGIVKKESKVARIVMVYHREGGNFKIDRIESSLPFIESEIKNVIPDQYYHITARVKENVDVPVGEFRGKLILHTSSEQMPRIMIPVQGFCQQPASLPQPPEK